MISIEFIKFLIDFIFYNEDLKHNIVTNKNLFIFIK